MLKSSHLSPRGFFIHGYTAGQEPQTFMYLTSLLSILRNWHILALQVDLCFLGHSLNGLPSTGFLMYSITCEADTR